MQLSKEEYARKRINNGSSVQIENSVTRVTVRHRSASRTVTLGDGIFNQHLTTNKDSYIMEQDRLRIKKKMRSAGFRFYT